MGEITRAELSAMTDQELLPYEREHHGDPYMSLLKAKGMQRADRSCSSRWGPPGSCRLHWPCRCSREC